MASVETPIRLANPGKRRMKRRKNAGKKRMTAKQIMYFGTKRQKAALKNRSHRRRNAGYKFSRKRYLKTHYASGKARKGHGKRRRVNVGSIMVVRRRANPSRRKRHRRNISQGFVDASGRFHPIRAASDYSPSRADEKTRKSRKRGKKKTMAKAHSKRKRNPGRRRYHVHSRRRNASYRRHRRRSNPSVRRHRRRNSPKVVVRYRNRRHARRHGRRRNPSFAGIGSGAMRVGGLFLGAMVTRYATGFVPAQFTGGWLGYIVTGAIAYLQGKLLGKLFRNPGLGQSMAEGGYVYLGLKIASDMGFGSNLPFGLSGGRGMGLIGPSSFYVPQVPMRGSMASFLVPPGVPSPMVAKAALHGIGGMHQNSVGGGRMNMRRVGRTS